ncbi:hypothetical protein EDC01DRAFT_632643 [Geopyxis carbonaria]|nr:hypothetical protein EDC01DRAFT_632643 [Geopyxis carbonaria]
MVLMAYSRDEKDARDLVLIGEADEFASPLYPHLLLPCIALPRTVKSRMPPTTGKTLSSSAELMDALHDIKTNNPDLTARVALIKLMHSYTISPEVFEASMIDQINTLFGELSYSEIVPFFNIPAVKPSKSFHLSRARLPLESVEWTCRLMESATYQYGPISMHGTDETCSRYMATAFQFFLLYFNGTMRNWPDEFKVEGEASGGGKFEHAFDAFLSTVLVFFRVGPSLAREPAIAQLIAECEARDVANASEGQWCPILGVLCDVASIQLFVYDSSSRTVEASDRVEAMTTDKDGLEFLKSVRRCVIANVETGAELLYDLFLMAYINGLESRCVHAHDPRKSHYRDTRESNNIRISGKHALGLAKAGLMLARKAHKLMEEGKLQEAEDMADRGADYVQERFLGPSGESTDTTGLTMRYHLVRILVCLSVKAGGTIQWIIGTTRK